MPEPHTKVPRLARLLPDALHARAVAGLVNHALRGQALAQRLEELSGKRFRLCIEDIPLALTFEIGAGGLSRTSLEPHVTMRGSLQDFIELARRREDPDALFFQRRLVVEGETETGLHLKNLLDGWEYDVPAHLRAVLPPPLATVTLLAGHGALGLRKLGQLRRRHSLHNSHPEGMEAAAGGNRPWHPRRRGMPGSPK